MSSSSSSSRSTGSVGSRRGGGSSQLLTGRTTGSPGRAAMHSSSGPPRGRPRRRCWCAPRAAHLLLRDVLAGHGLHEVRPAQRHRAEALHHRHEVGEPGDVRGARRAGPSIAATCGTTPHIDDLLAEQVAGAREQRARRRLDPRARRVDQPHDRDPLAERQLPQPRDLLLADLPIEPAITVKSYAATPPPPVDLAEAGDHAVRRRVLALHRALEKCGRPWMPELGERALVEQQLQPLPRGELALPCWRSIRSRPPPSRTWSRRSCRSSTSERRGGRATSVSAGVRSVLS